MEISTKKNEKIISEYIPHLMHELKTAERLVITLKNTIDDELKSCKIILKAATIDDESKSCKIMLKGGGEARSVKWSHEQTSIDLLDIIIDPAGLCRSAQGRKWTALS